MTTQPSLRRVLRRGTIALIGFELGLALVYIALIVQRGKATTLFDFNGLRSLPSLLQAAHLFTLGSLCLLLLLRRHRMVRPCSWGLPLALASLCFYGGLDELTKVHLIFDAINWKVVYLGLLTVVPLMGWRDLLWVWRDHRVTLQWILAGLGIFLLGGFGAEMLKGAIAADLPLHAASRGVFLSEHLRITLEEFAELMGETLILFGLADFTLRVLPPRSTHE